MSKNTEVPFTWSRGFRPNRAVLVWWERWRGVLSHLLKGRTFLKRTEAELCMPLRIKDCLTKPRPPCIGCCEEVLTKKYDNGCIFTLQILVVKSWMLFGDFIEPLYAHRKKFIIVWYWYSFSAQNKCVPSKCRHVHASVHARTHTHTHKHTHTSSQGTSDKESHNTTRWESRRHWADVSAIWKPHAESFIVNKTF